MADAVECLAEAGLTAEQVARLIGGCRERTPGRWRERFWALALKAACANTRARTEAG